jgi:glycine oxidase
MKVVILGAGLLGRLLALALAREGHAVVLHDAKGPQADGAAAWVAAAMLAPLAESVITEAPVVRMGLHGLTRWPQLLAGLSQPVFFQREGTLILWHRQDAAQAQLFGQRLHQTVQQLQASPAQAGLELPTPERLHAPGLQALEPSLESRFQHGIYLPQEGQLDNRALLVALLHELTQLGVAQHWQSPQDLASARRLHPDADWVIDTRGMGAQPNLPELRGVRGEVVRVHAPDVQLSRPTRLLHPRYPIYIAPKPEGVFVIGATEIESEDLSPASVRSCMELMSAAYAVHPGFGEARILEIGVQARPTLPDNLPRIDCPEAGVMRINGLYRHGYLISPAVVDAALAWLLQGSDDLAQQWQLCA